MPVAVFEHPTVLIRARALTGYGALVRDLGGEPGPLFELAGLSADALAGPDTLLCLSKTLALLQATAARLDAPDFALQLARRQTIEVLGAVALIARHCPTLGEALTAIERNMSYHSPGVLMKLEEDGARPGFWRCRFDFTEGTTATRRQGMELCLGVAEQFFLSVSGGQAHDWRISFRHDSPLAAADYARLLRSEVSLGQPMNAISIPGWVLELPIAPDARHQQAEAERHVSNLIRRFPLDLPQQVDAMVSRHLADGSSSLVRIAQQLRLHERTLQRRLREHGVTFEDIVDRIRRRRAEEYLSQSAMPLAALAAMLGYTEQSSFIRSCRRWFGMTPQAYRERHGQEAGR